MKIQIINKNNKIKKITEKMKLINNNQKEFLKNYLIKIYGINQIPMMMNL